jgi:hypothetical protein
MFRLLFGLSMILLSVSAAAETLKPIPDHVTFYLPKFQAVFDNVAASVYLAHLCAQRFSDCRKEFEEKDVDFDFALQPFREATLFEDHYSAYDSVEFKDSSEIAKTIGVERNRLMEQSLFAYELELFPRYAAVLRVCPDKDNASAAVSRMRLRNFVRYWQLDTEALRTALLEIDQRRFAHTQEIRARWSREQCVAARKLGALLMHGMRKKLLPYEEGSVRSSKDRFSDGAAFVWSSTIQLESEVGNRKNQ